jgi:LuxR family transcriptional regulator, regulator of acetate metabolism
VARSAHDDAQVALGELAGLLAASRRVAGLLDSAVLAQRAAHEARQLVGTEIATLAILEDPALLIMRGTSGTRTSAIEQLRIPRGTGLGGKILLEQRPISLSDYAVDEGITHDHVDAVSAAEGIRAVVGVPVVDDDQVLGILYGGLRSVGSVGERGQALLVEFARSLGPVLGSARRAHQARHLSAQAERQRIALELHDTLGQLLFGIGLAARRAQAGSQTSADLLASLEDIETRASHAASQLRDALRALSPSTSAEVIATAIHMDTEAFTNRSGVPAHFVMVGEPVDLKPPVAALLVAAVREGLHNVEKYARASSVIVTLHYERGVGVVIQDDGVGLPPGFGLEPLPRGGRRLGLASLLQRAQQLGGSLVLVPNEDGGVTLRVNVPLEPVSA